MDSFSTSREFDVVLYGATGFTGAYVAKELNRSTRRLRWAIAGRSEEKLKKLVQDESLGSTKILVADVSDPASLERMAERTRLVLNATGPYRFYGEAVVKACISAGTHYADLCGEPEFIDRCLLKFDDEAKRKKVAVVHSCAFDSVPADVGTLFAATEFVKGCSGGEGESSSPALCNTVEMFHAFSFDESVLETEAEKRSARTSAGANATTFRAAVHGFAGADSTRRQRKQLLEKLEADRAGSSKQPVPIGVKLRTAAGPKYVKELDEYAFLFPGSDVAVVRTSQRMIHAQNPLATNLVPQFGASFCVGNSYKAVFKTVLYGSVFNFLVKTALGRRLLLRYPSFFSGHAFSDDGPTPASLKATAWKTHLFAKGWASRSHSTEGLTPRDRQIHCSVSGPEPGYLATAKMFVAMGRAVLELGGRGATGGVFTPGAFVVLAGSGDGKEKEGGGGISSCVELLREAGIKFSVEGEGVTIIARDLVYERAINKQGRGSPSYNWATTLKIFVAIAAVSVLVKLIQIFVI